MDALDQVEPENDQRASPAAHRLSMAVALTVALLATFMGITKVKNDNIVQATLQAKSDAVDAWSEFQAKSTKQHLSAVTDDQFRVQRALAKDTAVRHLLDERIAFYHAEEARYDRENSELAKKAKSLGASYDSLNFHDDQFDLSDALLSIALASLAITALTRQRWLYYAALIPALFGVAMGIAGLFGWVLHPTALTRLLS
jgi:hypothetical protein